MAITIVKGLTATDSISNASITNSVITNSSISTRNYMDTGRWYPSVNITGAGAGTIMVADTIYCCPWYQFVSVTGLTQIGGRVLTGGTSSNLKFAIATKSGSTATVITTLNPTGVASNSSNSDIVGSFSAVNLDGNEPYLLCAIGAGTVMPILNGVSNNSLQAWMIGNSSTYTGGVTGWTGTGGTYAGGFPSTFPLTASSSTVIPWLGIIAP